MIDSPCDIHTENTNWQSFGTPPSQFVVDNNEDSGDHNDECNCQSFGIPPSQFVVDNNKDSGDHDDEYGEVYHQSCNTLRERQREPQS